LKQKQQQFEEQLKNRPSFVSNTQSRAESVVNMIRNGDFTFSKKLDNTLKEQSVDWWPQGGRTDFPDENCRETDECQPFVSEMLNLFVSGKVKVKNLRGKTKEVIIRSIPFPEAFKTATVGNKSPDVVFFDGLNKTGSSAVTVEGEVKGGGKGEFSGDQIGQLTDGMSRLMNLQPFRKFMYGFLTDGRRFLYILCMWDNNEYRFEYSSTFVGQIGWQVTVLN
jgi:hypothetical protein